jgi:hypothetical protein
MTCIDKNKLYNMVQYIVLLEMNIHRVQVAAVVDPSNFHHRLTSLER